MAIRTYDILLDSYNSTMPEPIVGRQGDKNGAVTLHVTITDRGTAVDLTGQTVNLIAETAKGTAVVADNAGVTLTDAVNGKFDYAIPNALWSESGKITKAYFSLNDTDGQQTTYDLIFIVKKAIDTSQDKADDYITIIDGTIRDLKTKVDAIYTDYQSGNFYNKSETDSKDSVTLSSANAYADSKDSLTLSSAKSYTDSKDSLTFSNAKSYTDNSLKGISSVPETFANLAAIKSKYPNGANGVMVAADNGHKYIWANSTWTDAGIYQSVGIADGSVGNNQLSPSALYGSIVSGAPAKINSKDKTLTLESVFNIGYGTKSISMGNLNVVIALDPENSGNTGFWIGCSPDSKEFSVYNGSNSIPENVVYLGWISINVKVDYDLHINAVEVDGLDTASLAFDKKAVVASQFPFSLNLKNKTLTPPDGYINIFTSKKTYNLSNRDPVSLSLDNGSLGCFVYYVISTESITITNIIVSQSSDLIFLGFISWDSPTPNYDFIFNYTVDGLVPGVGLGFGFANKIGTTFGDSITQGVKLNGATNWTTMIGEKLHLSKITNAGLSGTTYSKDASRTDSAVERANTITGQDLITVWFGINDYHYGRPLGVFGDGDVTTVFGAADYVYKTLITNNPTATIVVITPMKQHGYLTSPDSFTKNSAGLLQIDYVNAIKQVADYYSLPVLDFYQMSGMSPFVDAQNTQYFFDGLHPNAAGQYRVAQKIARFIEING